MARRDAGRFVIAVKGSRYITHPRRLRDVQTPLANFFASGVLRLGPKLGLPPLAISAPTAVRPRSLFRFHENASEGSRSPPPNLPNGTTND